MAANNYWFPHAEAQYGGISSIGGSGLGPSGVSSGYVGSYTTPQSLNTSGQSNYASGNAVQSAYQSLYGTRTQAFSPTSGLYDSRDMYYSSAQADALSTLAQQGSATDSQQQLNVHSSLVTSDDRQSVGGGGTSLHSTSERGHTSGNYGLPSYRNDSGQRRRLYNNEGSYSSWSRKPPNYASNRPRSPPKPSQLHYCEICKISCAGAQTYMEHLEGKNHKKREAMTKNAAAHGGSTAEAARINKHFHCELCDVVCTCSDTFTAHLRGTKHNKVLSLHQKLGKLIPDQSKLLQTAADGKTASAASKITGFVGGGPLKMAGDASDATADDHAGNGSNDQTTTSDDIQPIGLEYIEEGCNDSGTAASFYCKLCDCCFTDPHAKLMHTKGRRHRQNYKMKVDPSLQVEVKVNPYSRRQQIDKLRSRFAGGNLWQKRRLEDIYRQEVEELRYEQERLKWQLNQAAHLGPSSLPHQPSVDAATTLTSNYCVHAGNDRYVTAKHAAIYPTAEDLDTVQSIVSHCEHALKIISDSHAQIELKTTAPETKEETTAPTEESSTAAAESTSDAAAAAAVTVDSVRELKGVMRVGLLAKGLLLHSDLELQLVVLCHHRPTKSLLLYLAERLPAELENITEEKYNVSLLSFGDGLVVQRQSEPCVTCSISLTSPMVKDDLPADDSDVYLNSQMCLCLLAALRHTKWFRAKLSKNENAVIVVRILRDICHRLPTWQPLGQWVLELLVEKCVSSCVHQLSPSVALQLVFESIASGILLPGGPGLMDPCEKQPVDAVSSLTVQQREDITHSAQHALRMIAFGDIHRLLGMEPLLLSVAGQRKRPANGVSAGGLQPD